MEAVKINSKAGVKTRFKRNRFIKRIVSNSSWIPTIAVLVLYISSGLLVLIGIFKLYKIVADIVVSEDFIESIDVIHILAQFIGIIEVYLLAIIFKIFAVGIFTLNIDDVQDYRGERVDTIEELKCELAKAIVLFLSVFLVQKVVLWDDGIRTLYYGIIITLISAVLIAFTIVLQTHIRKKNEGEVVITSGENEKIVPKNTNALQRIGNGQHGKRSSRLTKRSEKDGK